MTRVVFISNAPERVAAAADWIVAAWRQRAPLLVWAPQREIAERLDRILWTTPAIGFVPHCRLDSALADQTPVLIAERLDSLPHTGCLLNLGTELPPDCERFDEIVEFVSTDDADRLPARERFRAYRQRGIVPENRDHAQGMTP